MRIREAGAEEYPALHRLFVDTVHTVCSADYTPAQLEAWAPWEVDAHTWSASFTGHRTFVALEEDAIVGFGDIAPDGYLDRLFTSAAHQRQGIATALCDALEASHSAAFVRTRASITARPFFERRGYRVVGELQVVRSGEQLICFAMEKGARLP